MSTKNKPYTVRTVETGDKVFMIKDDTSYWVTSPEALKEQGFELGEEKTIEYKVFLKFKEGKTIRAEKKADSIDSTNTTAINTKTDYKVIKPILDYKEEATLEDYDKYNA